MVAEASTIGRGLRAVIGCHSSRPGRVNLQQPTSSAITSRCCPLNAEAGLARQPAEAMSPVAIVLDLVNPVEPEGRRSAGDGRKGSMKLEGMPA
jgi:hypothetical protein